MFCCEILSIPLITAVCPVQNFDTTAVCPKSVCPLYSPQENAHFSISESLIAAIELMKCNMMSRQMEEEEEDSDKEIQELKQKIRIRRQQIRTRHLHPAYREMGLDSECFLLQQAV